MGKIKRGKNRHKQGPFTEDERTDITDGINLLSVIAKISSSDQISKREMNKAGFARQASLVINGKIRKRVLHYQNALGTTNEIQTLNNPQLERLVDREEAQLYAEATKLQAQLGDTPEYREIPIKNPESLIDALGNMAVILRYLEFNYHATRNIKRGKGLNDRNSKRTN